ncbi:MAG: chemotaxis protein CheR [Gammaproteobacteria bacterium]|nr:chemotaxis protein CheR [Gammaproteobacteria bacterium]
MQDSDCVEFLQWVLPRLHRRWPGFRKVRAQVCKRIDRRCKALGLAGPRAYRDYLEGHPDEWEPLDRLCPITISSFYRDKAVFDFLGCTLLPHLARDAHERAAEDLRALSIGCASGEEPYTLKLAWHFHVAPDYRQISLHIVATDVVSQMLERARKACYPPGSLKWLPEAWRTQAFEPVAGKYCLRAAFRQGIEFIQQDVRAALPEGSFNLILCRNLVFTYFDEGTQQQTLEQLLTRLSTGGALVIGRHETLPSRTGGLIPWPGTKTRGIFQRR